MEDADDDLMSVEGMERRSGRSRRLSESSQNDDDNSEVHSKRGRFSSNSSQGHEGNGMFHV